MAKRGGFPGGMPGNMNNLMKQAQRMQRQMEEQQAALESKEFTATAGGGVVEVTVTGKREVTKVKIDPEAVDPDDVEMLEDLIVAATNEALRKCEEESQASAMPRGREQAFRYHDRVVTAMNELRRPADELEKMVDKTYWPFPTYADLIFEV